MCIILTNTLSHLTLHPIATDKKKKIKFEGY